MPVARLAQLDGNRVVPILMRYPEFVLALIQALNAANDQAANHSPFMNAILQYCSRKPALLLPRLRIQVHI